MWYLTSANDKRVIYVTPGNNITIGRNVDTQNCNFAIPEDPSISRKHVTLSVEDKHLYLQDLGSKYGTFLNENAEKVEHNIKMKLNCHDIIRFGKMGNVWKVNNISFITCTSTLRGDYLQNLKTALHKLGGELKNEWDESCAYLTMPAITLTIKVVLALVQSSYIVNTDYWIKCVEAVSKNSDLPNPENFIPNIMESTLNKENVSFLPLNERSALFSGKKIIFFSRRQYEMYKTALIKSSGTPLLMSETKMTKAMLCEIDVIVIQYNSNSFGQETQAHREQINEIIEYIKTKEKRIIADAEIGLAILYCSISKYCNPDFKFSEVMKQTANINNKANNILAPESQEPSQNIKKEKVEIHESLTSNDESAVSLEKADQLTSKRKFSDEFEHSSSSTKKIALDDTSSSIPKKRPFEELASGSESVPLKKIAISNEMGEEIFNFEESQPETSSNKNVNNKKLNLFKPLKRKIEERDEDDLFNFEEEKEKVNTVNTLNISKKLQKQVSSLNDVSSKTKLNNEVNLEALRGSKLQELMKINENIKSFKDIKKEDISEIDEKFSNIDLGSTILIVKKDLIVKREPVFVTDTNNKVKNFKKFKKVWPVTLQVTHITNHYNNLENNRSA